MSEICLFVSTEPWDFESAAIRWGTLCDWSHAGWFDTRTQLTYSAMNDGKGLTWRPLRKRQKLLLLDAPGAAESLALALKYEGAAYDIRDILGIVFHRNWRTEGRFICDVALFHFQTLAGYPLLNCVFIPLEHLTPRDLLLSPSITQRLSCSFN